jgi:hypothetical protein
MRNELPYASILLLITAGVAARADSSINLIGTSDIVSFNGKSDTITIGSASCPDPNTGNCAFAGTQSLGTGDLTWTITTPNTSGNITYDPFGDITQETAGSFSGVEGADSLTGTFLLNAWTYDGNSYGPDGEYQGIDLEGTITNLQLTDGSANFNNQIFNGFLDQPAATSYDVVLDVGNCTSGTKTEPCIPDIQQVGPADPTATFNSLELTPNSTTPEPGTLVLLLTGAAAGFRALRRRRLS